MNVMPDWAEHPDLVQFYSSCRSRPEDLYPSERRFLPWLAHRSASVLDAGCAAGGFSHIWRHYRQDVSYSGVDVSTSLVETARRLHPDLRFVQANLAGRCELPDCMATTVQALGWLFWEPEYVRTLAELWRLTDRYLFFDLRLVRQEKDASCGRQRMAYSGNWDGRTTTPYITVAWPSIARLFVELRPRTLYAYGYWGKPADTVERVGGDVCFSVFVLEKPAPDETIDTPVVCTDMPLAWPAELAGLVRVLPRTRLAELVPPDEHAEEE
jgi:SAM-dependent methyltransferase